MSIDPNIYALSIQLDMDSGQAFDSLDAFDSRIGKIEQDVSKAVQESIASVESSADTAAKSLDSAKSIIAGILSLSDDLGNSLSAAAANSDITDQLDGQLKLQEEILKSQTMAGDLLARNQEVSEDIADVLKEEHHNIEEIVEFFKELQDVIEKKNLGHEEELGLVEKESEAVQSINKGWLENIATLGGVYYTLDRIANRIARISDDTEHFTNANYRAYGAQLDLLNSTRMLTAESGIFYETALEAMKVLGDLRVPRDELEQYAKMVGMMNRVTGMSIPTIAKYAHSLRAVGRTADQIEEHLLGLQEKMRKFSLSAEDMGKILDSTAFSARELSMIFADADAAEAYAGVKIELTSLAKQLGVTEDMAAGLDQVLGDQRTMALMSRALGKNISTTEDFQAGILAFADAHGTAMNQIEADIKKGGAAAERAMVQQKALQDAVFGGNKALYEFSASLASVAKQDRDMLRLAKAVAAGGPAAATAQQQMEKLAKERGLEVSEIPNHVAQLNKLKGANNQLSASIEYQRYVLEQLKADAMDPFSEANNTLFAQLRMLRDRVGSLISTAWAPLERSLTKVLQAVNYLINGLVWLTKGLHTVYSFLNRLTGGAFGQFIDFVFLGIAAIGGLILVCRLASYLTASLANLNGSLMLLLLSLELWVKVLPHLLKLFLCILLLYCSLRLLSL